MTIRKGSEKDCKDLAQSLRNLDFEVRIHEDPTLETISTVLRKSEYDLSKRSHRIFQGRLSFLLLLLLFYIIIIIIIIIIVIIYLSIVE